MLQDAQASAELQSADGDALVEPDAPGTEPVEAFVQRTPTAQDDAEPAEAAAPAEVAFVGAPIQDDLLPQLPRRNRRSRNAASAPAVPDQLLRIAAAQDGEPATAEVVDESAEVMEPVTAGLPPLPRREMDGESVAPPPAASAQPVMPEPTKPAPNYELFAAFRAATDQGRADAVRGSDGGGA
jgi:hypothetical protein